MTVVESVIMQYDLYAHVRLSCGHEANLCGSIKPGQAIGCKECSQKLRKLVQPATEAQLDEIASDYAETMRARGVVIGKPEEQMIRRSAAIQDAWRCAFARVLK